ncbi:MAG: M16 family metallopeptidase [Bacteroidales bacterium]
MKRKIIMSMALGLLTLAPVAAQQMPQIPPLPLDPQVRYGKLENGLTYYIRKNAQPEQRAEFYIAQKVGSILEDSTQLGLAHFLEHMAFNGSKNFPENSMIKWLETIGVKFGENLNAYTSIEETVYNISNVPTIRESIVDSCLLILHDWAGALTLEADDIDKERGVIQEEWRTRNTAGSRMLEGQLIDIYPNSRYANRLPIGDINIIRTFPYDVLRDYYHQWYRPDQQGILIVGDIDVDKVESKIKTMFADFKVDANAPERVYYTVDDNNEPLVSIQTDKEAQSTTFRVWIKHDAIPNELKPTQVSLIQGYMTEMISSMLNNRLYEISQKPNSPVLGAGAAYSNYYVSSTKDAFMVGGLSKEGESLKGFRAIMEELEKVKRFGFTFGEYDRAQKDFMSKIESAYNERDKRKNGEIVQELVNHFVNNTPVMGIEMEHDFYKSVLPQITLEAINQTAAQLLDTKKNMVYTLEGPAKDGLTYPSKEEIATIGSEVAAMTTLEAYVDNVSNEPLISKLPKAGKVKKSETDKLGNTVWTLSNGIKVILKPTDFKQDQILMTARSEGGSSLFSDADQANFMMMGDIVSLGGLGNFSRTDLQKALSGKIASVSPSVRTQTEVITGSSTPKDFETLMQLTYLQFTAPRKDAEAFESFKERMAAQLKNQELNPMTIFVDSMRATTYNRHPRAKSMNLEMLNKINYDRVLELYKERFMDPNNFTFTFVGNLNLEEIKPLVEQYIASLPKVKRNESAKDIQLYPVKGNVKNYFNHPMEVSKATVYSIFSGDAAYNLPNLLKMTILSQVMNIVYNETIREAEGGTYGVSVNGSLDKLKPGKEVFSLSFYFDTNPEQRDKLLSIAHEQLRKITVDGPRAQDFQKVKEFLAKKYNENLRENNYWLNIITNYYEFGFNSSTEYEAALNAITTDDIKDFAKMMLDQNNNSEIIMSSQAN